MKYLFSLSESPSSFDETSKEPFPGKNYMGTCNNEGCDRIEDYQWEYIGGCIYDIGISGHPGTIGPEGIIDNPTVYF